MIQRLRLPNLFEPLTSNGQIPGPFETLPLPLTSHQLFIKIIQDPPHSLLSYHSCSLDIFFPSSFETQKSQSVIQVPIMATPSSKPSSSPTPCRTNPVSRNSELNNNPMRRSFSGNPFAKPSAFTNPRALNSPSTPSNSPSGFRARQSTDRESQASWRDLEDKENGKDPNTKPGRARSPAPSKITKNFMSPTISAASKINPSPRKKILVERNEPARSSVSSSDAKSLIMEENELKEEMHQKNESSLLLDSTNGEEKDLVNLEPTFKISPRVRSSSSVPLAPLDADPSMPPYDPKTNFLSPRPQFLHYKPNPRIELYRGRESEQLEASLSDTDVNTEETWSDDSQKELEDLFSSEMEKDDEGEEEVEKELLSSVENVENKRTSKAKFIFSGSKLAALLLVLALSLYSISLTDMSPYQQTLERYGSLEFQVPDGVTQLAKAKFDGLAQKVEQWSSDTSSFMSQLSKWVMHDHDPFPSQYANSSSLYDGNLVDGLLKFEQGEVEPPIAEIKTKVEAAGEEDGDQLETEEDEYIDEATETDQDAEDQLHEEVQARVVEVEQQAENFEAELKDHAAQSEQLEQQTEMESHAQMEKVTEIAEICASQTAAVEIQDFIQEEPSSEQNTNNRGEAAFENAEFRLESAQLEASSTDFIQETLLREANTNNNLQTTSEEAELRPEHTQLEASSSIDEAEGMFSADLVPVTSLCVLCLCAVAAAILLTKKSTSASNSSAPEQVPAEKLDTSPISVAVQHHTSEETGDLVSHSGPSQVSSFQKSSKELEACSEARSRERRVSNNPNKRESLASSDYSNGGGGCSPSYSYGSFTTYEKIHKKHGGEEEIVTPVRRSSRIRNQVASSAS